MSAETGEGITFSVPPLAHSGLCALAEDVSHWRGGAAAVAEGEENQLAPPPAGSFWNVESAAAPVTGCPAAASGSSAVRCRGNSGGGGGRRTTVAYVINEESQGQQVVSETEALQSLREACETVGATLETLHFGKLDFGETTVLDRFYNAGACVTPSPSSAVRGRYRGENSFLGSRRASYFTSCPTLGAASGAARLLPALAVPRSAWVLAQEPVCIGARDRLTHGHAGARGPRGLIKNFYSSAPISPSSLRVFVPLLLGLVPIVLLCLPVTVG